MATLPRDKPRVHTPPATHFARPGPPHPNTPAAWLTPCMCTDAPFAPQGLVFAVATESGVIKLYDVRSYDKGPFDTFVVRLPACLRVCVRVRACACTCVCACVVCGV